MAEAVETKHERVHLRLDAKSKRKLERAAAYEETTVSRFVLRNAVAAAERMIEARERIASREDGTGHGARPSRNGVAQRNQAGHRAPTCRGRGGGGSLRDHQ